MSGQKINGFLISRAIRIVLQSTKSTVFHINAPLQV